MSIYQLLRHSVAFLIDSISNGYTLITIHELKPWVFFAFKDQNVEEEKASCEGAEVSLKAESKSETQPLNSENKNNTQPNTSVGSSG